MRYEVLLDPCSFPGRRGVAAVALPAVPPEVHVILLVAREAVLGELHLIGRAPMTGLAGELAVRTREGESGLLAVIELPQPPAVGGVAAGAVLAEVALVHVVLLVTV